MTNSLSYVVSNSPGILPTTYYACSLCGEEYLYDQGLIKHLVSHYPWLDAPRPNPKAKAKARRRHGTWCAGKHILRLSRYYRSKKVQHAESV